MQLAFCEANLSYLEVFLYKSIKKMYLIFVFINFLNRYNIGILHVSNVSRKKLIQRLGCRITSCKVSRITFDKNSLDVPLYQRLKIEKN